MNFLTSETLIESVKNRALIPDNQVTFQTNDFLSFANEELIIGLVPSMLIYHEDYLLFTEDVPLVNGQSNYKIPYRSIGNKLRDVFYKDNNGNFYEMSRIPIDDVVEYQGSMTNTIIQHYYVKNNEVVLVPSTTGTNTGNLTFAYYFRPNNLVEVEKVAFIENIDLDTGEIFVNDIPEDFSLTKMDFIKWQTPFKILGYDVTPTNINSATNIITFDPDDIPTDLEVGDQISLAGETNVPQLPSDVHSMLAQRIAIQCLDALGDIQGLANAKVKLKEMELSMASIIDNRIEGSPQKIPTRHTPLKMSRSRYRRWW